MLLLQKAQLVLLMLAMQHGKYYAAADTIDIKTVNAADAAVMRLWALVADCS